MLGILSPKMYIKDIHITGRERKTSKIISIAELKILAVTGKKTYTQKEIILCKMKKNNTIDIDFKSPKLKS